MKVLTLAVAFMSMLVAAVPGQNSVKPDFSGTWTLYKVENSGKLDKVLKEVSTDSSVRRAEKLKIEHNDPVLKISVITIIEEPPSIGNPIKKSESVEVSVYYTDKRGEKNKLDSKTKWNGKTIETLTKFEKNAQISVRTRYSLSDDKKELTVTDVFIQPNYDRFSPFPEYELRELGSKRIYKAD